MIISRIKKNVEGWEDAVLVSPDMGGAKRCTWLASELALDFALVPVCVSLCGCGSVYANDRVRCV